MDLADFFGSVTGGRVKALFRALGYGAHVADALMGLTTHRAPKHVLRQRTLDLATRRRFRDRHLPQGAPTSPALANLAAWRLDVRLSALAAAAGATYTRYADDLAFSGGPPLAAGSTRFLDQVAAIALEEGFSSYHRKTRRMTRAERQILAGVVVNERPGVPRAERERLEAILHNCVRSGPETQNREGHPDFRAHLLGRVTWVAHVSPAHGAPLRALFDRISWP